MRLLTFLEILGAPRRKFGLRAAPRAGLELGLVMVLATAAFTFSKCFGFQAAETGSRLTFDAVSVKAVGGVEQVRLPDGRQTLNIIPFRFRGQSVTATERLSSIIQQAYGLEDWELVCPEWAHSSLYEISARTPPDTSIADARRMLQDMLDDRFGLKFHHEAKRISGYALLEGSQGFKLVPADNPGPSSVEMREGQYKATGTLDGLRHSFMNYTDKPLIGTVAREGVYHIELHWDADPSAPPGRHYEPMFWRELERLAGLKIEKRELPCSVLVVDHIERVPTPN